MFPCLGCCCIDLGLWFERLAEFVLINSDWLFILVLLLLRLD